jgi:hypothetical protein
MKHHHALALCLRMIPRVKPGGMLFGKLLHTFPDHALCLRMIFSENRYTLFRIMRFVSA